ncbi:MAG: hypothetical protein CL607_19945 [Anaerolineaceae bacterium]|nr:hypothetical protein [Anaerolineaceae bacterium]
MVKRAKRIEPGPGQESVWDYPRPPRMELSDERVRVVFNGVTIADSKNAFRVLETSHPPTYYIPPEDVQMQFFSPTNRMTFCEYKGAASYYTLNVDGRIEENVAWAYKNPTPGFREIDGYIALYPGRMDACYVDDELVQAQEGDFYGGWITSKIVGPFKGAPGTLGW